MEHVPVLFNESINYINPESGRVIVDCTLGRAGHTAGFLERGAEVIGFDRDLLAIQSVAAKYGLKKIKENPAIYRNGKLTIIHANFGEIGETLLDLGISAVDGFFWDLGVSSPQFDDARRGFSYRFDARLDMRMDQTQEKSAWDIVNTYDQKELMRIIRTYGEERFARGISREIIQKRPIDTTLELVEVIKMGMPKRAQYLQHPAKRTFQAIRIAVNDELGTLERSLRDSLGLLAECGRLGVISFHSLEDRIVKDFYRKGEDPCNCPKDIPYCVCGKKPTLKIITRRPVIPKEAEVIRNRRSKSAKLRIAEKIVTPKEVGK